MTFTTPELDFAVDDVQETIRFNKNQYNVDTVVTYRSRHGRMQATFTASVPDLMRWFADCYSTNDDETDAELLIEIFTEGVHSR